MAAQRKKGTGKRARGDKHQFAVRGVLRNPPDVGKISRALLGLAQAEAERQAQAEHAARTTEHTQPGDASISHGLRQGDAHA